MDPMCKIRGMLNTEPLMDPPVPPQYTGSFIDCLTGCNETQCLAFTWNWQDDTCTVFNESHLFKDDPPHLLPAMDTNFYGIHCGDMNDTMNYTDNWNYTNGIKLIYSFIPINISFIITYFPHSLNIFTYKNQMK